MSDSTPSKKERLKPRKVRRAEARAKGIAFVPQYNFTSGSNRADRRAMVKMGRLLFNKGLWVRELAIAIRGMLRRAGTPIERYKKWSPITVRGKRKEWQAV